ncbi:MAG TPA: outer membrane beta-barrel protein [Candidatus Udaeobacter sp.]|nr:outer membrane beta-barrel protein [Candidatus Udaeobacter sp.]
MTRVVAVLGLLLAASPVAAQRHYDYDNPHRFEVGVGAGYTLSEGFETENFQFAGQTFNDVDPKSGFSYGLSFAYLVQYFGEVGFMFNQQASEAQISGNLNERDIFDLNINNYHGYGAYNFGMGAAKLQPFFLFGLGATQYSPGDFQGNNLDSETKFSTVWGGGAKFYPDDNIGIKFSGLWTPTYIKTDADGWWCDPFYGCFLTGDSDYSNQFEFAGSLLYRF